MKRTGDSSDRCPMCEFDYQVCQAVVAVGKRHGLKIKGSVTPTSKGTYNIGFTASPVSHRGKSRPQTSGYKEGTSGLL